jgi:hypothetical protein
MSLPLLLQHFLSPFAGAFTQPSWKRFSFLVVAAILTTGSKTISNLTRTLRCLSFGHGSSFHRLLSQRKWDCWRLSYILSFLIISTFYGSDTPIRIVGDDTVDGHRGKKVFGKSRHRDAVRSSRNYTAFRYGHKWVVLAVLVQVPYSQRPWALPCLVALYRSEKDNKKLGIRHKTPPEIMRQLLLQMMRWFPNRRFIFSGDSGFSTFEISQLAHQASSKLAVVGKFYANANLHAPAPRKTYSSKGGRPKVHGRKLPSPAQVVKAAKDFINLTVLWYGGGTRKVAILTGTGIWTNKRRKVPVKWVFVRDMTGTHRDDYFYTTDLSFSAKEIIEIYTGRWSIETTFQEMRSYLGLESTRGWKKETIMRSAPSLFGLYSLVVLIYQQIPAIWKNQTGIQWVGKTDRTFSDLMTSLRRWLWFDWVFATLDKNSELQQLPTELRQTLMYCVAQAA